MSCSNPPDGTAEEGEVLMPRREKVTRRDKSICARCRTLKGKFMVRALAYCRECFFLALSQRFHRNIYTSVWRTEGSSSSLPEQSRNNTNGGKQFTSNRPFLQKGQVLVAVSGGAGSMSMLDMLSANQMVGKGDGHRPDKTKGEKQLIWDRGSMVYVEFAGVTGMKDRIEEMAQLAKDRGLTFIGLRAEDVYLPDMGGQAGAEGEGRAIAVDLALPDLPVQASSSTHSNATSLDRLRALLDSLPPASRPAMMSNILTALIQHAATTLGDVSHVLIGETSTREAQRVISGTATGRGWSIPLELAPALGLRHEAGDDSESEAQAAKRSFRVKALKDVSLKEAAIYCQLKGVRTVNERRWATEQVGMRGKAKAPSLEMLTEQFIAGLSVTHPSTVSTINKTGDKLVFPGDADGELCPLCQSPVDASARDWKNRSALTRLPRTPQNGHTSAESEDKGERRLDLADLLCYACLTTCTPVTHGRAQIATSDVVLPTWVGQQVLRSKKVVSDEDMRKEIESFLL